MIPNFKSATDACECVLALGPGSVAVYWGGKGFAYEDVLPWAGFDGSKDCGRHAEYVAEMKRRGLK